MALNKEDAGYYTPDQLENQKQNNTYMTQANAPVGTQAFADNKNNPTAISADSLMSPVSKINLPTQSQDNTDYNSIIKTGQGIIDNVNKTGADKSSTDSLTSYLTGISENQPPDMATEYGNLYDSMGIANREAAVNESKKKIAALNAKLSGINAGAESATLSLEDQTFGNGGIDSAAFLGRQQAEVRRQAAISSLPIQALILAENANLTGNVALLESANERFNTLFQIKSTQATNNYNYRKEVLKTIYDYADKEQQRKLDRLDKEEDRKYTREQNNIKTVQSYVKTSLESGQSDVAAKLAQLDPKSASFNTDVSTLVGQLKPDTLDRQYKQAQIAKIYNDMNGGGNDKLLSPSEASTLGVPYGTTKAQAADMGITPQGKTTQAQQTVAGYATRIEDASTILNNLESSISKYNPLKFWAEQKSPTNYLKSQTFQQYDQASRNLINSILRRESGAVISDQEFENARKQYLPLPGDTEEVLKQKRENIQSVLKNYKNAAGNAYESTNDLVNGGTSQQTVNLGGQNYQAGSIITNSKGQKARIEVDGSLTIIK